MAKTCPRCGLVNPDSASTCDCGLPFPDGPAAARRPDNASGGWYYLEQGRTQGPVSLDELRSRVISGQLKLADEVWRAGTPDWVPIRSVRELFPARTPATGDAAGGPPSGEAAVAVPQREGTSPAGPAVTGDLALLPLVRRSTNGTLVLRRDVLVLTSARPTALSEEAILGSENIPGRHVRFYALRANVPGEVIERVRVRKAANLGISRRRLRFDIETRHRTDQFILPKKQAGHVLTVLRQTLGERLTEDSTFRLTWTERILIGLSLVGSLLLGLGIAGSDWDWFESLAPIAIGIGASILSLTILAVFVLLVVDLGTPRSRRVTPSSRRRRPRREPYRSRSVGWLLKFAALAYLGILFCSGVIAYVPERLHSLAGAVLSIPGLFLLFTGYRLSQRVFAPGQHPDPRPPIVYLRSFADDDFTNLQPDSMLAELHGLNRATGRQSLFGRLGRYLFKLHPVRVLRLFFNIGADTSEEVLAQGFRRHGPFIAIGRPGEGLPTAGADRMYVGDDEWQHVVIDYLNRCKAVILQPSTIGYILWEIGQTFRRVERHRIFLCMINFRDRPEDYDDFRLRLVSDHGVQLPRLVPFRDSPGFVYFETDGTPRTQDLCYRSPIFWSFTGNAVHIRRTLKSFLAGLDGGSRPRPLPARRHRGHGVLSLGVYAAFALALLFPAPLIFYGGNLALMAPNLSFSSTTYTGRAIDYRVTLGNAWRRRETLSAQGAEHFFTLAGDAGTFAITCSRDRNDPWARALRELPRGPDGLPSTWLSVVHPELVDEIEGALRMGFTDAGVKVGERSPLSRFEHDPDPAVRLGTQALSLAVEKKGIGEVFIEFEGERIRTVHGRAWHEFRFACHIRGVGTHIVRHRVFADLGDVVTVTAGVPDMDFYNGLAIKALDAVEIVTTTRDRLTKALSAEPTKTVSGKKVPCRLRLPDVWTEKELKVPPGIVLPPDSMLEDAMFDLEGKFATVGILSVDEELGVTEPGADRILADVRRATIQNILDQIARNTAGPPARIVPLSMRRLTVADRPWIEIKHRIEVGSKSYIDLLRVCDAGGGAVGFEANLYIEDELVERLVEAAFRSLELPPDRPKQPKKTVVYQGKRLGYEFRLGKHWSLEPIPPEWSKSEHFFSYLGGVGKFVVDVLDEELGDADRTAQTLLKVVEASVRKKVPSAQVTLLETRAVTANGTRWLDLKLEQNYGPDARETKRIRIYQSLGQCLMVSVVLPPFEDYDRLSEEVLATVRITETPGDCLLRQAREGKPIEFHGKAMKYTLTLPPLWNARQPDAQTIREVMQAAERAGTPAVMPEHMFSLRKEKLADLSVEVEEEERDLDLLDEIAKNQVKLQQQLLRTMFPGVKVEVRLVGSRKVQSGGRQWGEVETTIEIVPARRGFTTISRFASYKGRTLSVSTNLYKDDPAVRKLASEALDSVRIVPVPPPAGAEKSWTNRIVVVTRSDIRMGKPGPKGKMEYQGTLQSLSYKVLADREGRLQIREHGQEGWFDKDDAVLQEHAVDYFTERIRQNPRDIDAYFGRAEAWNLSGKTDKVIDDYTTVIRLNPRNAVAFYNRGGAWYNKPDYDRAITDYTEAIRLDPSDADSFNARGNCWRVKSDYDRAIKDYDEAIRLGPASALHIYNRGLCWHFKRDYDKAIKDYSEAIRMDPSYLDAFNNRARAWNGKRNYDKAIEDFGEVIRLNPRGADAYYNRGTCWRNKKQYDRAIKDFDEAIRLDPRWADAFNDRGVCWAARGEYDKAIQDYSEAIRLNPKDTLAINNRGHCWQTRKQYDRAIKDFDETVRLDARNTVALNAKAWLLAVCPVEKVRDGKKAIALARRACELTDWKQMEYIATWAAAYAEAGDFTNAVRWQKYVLQDEDYASRHGEEARKRLELYENEKPYRED